jgi:hypothetical protein
MRDLLRAHGADAAASVFDRVAAHSFLPMPGAALDIQPQARLDEITEQLVRDLDAERAPAGSFVCDHLSYLVPDEDFRIVEQRVLNAGLAMMISPCPERRRRRRQRKGPDSKVKSRLADLGGTVLGGVACRLGKLIAKVIRAANIKPE